MKFHAFLTDGGVSLLEERFLPALHKLGKLCHLYLTPDHFFLLHNLLSGDGLQAVAQFRTPVLFEDYRISRKNDGRIAFSVDVSLLLQAVRSSIAGRRDDGSAASSGHRIQIRVVRKASVNSTQRMPFLTFKTKGHRSVAVIQEVPISNPLPRAQVLQLQTALDAAQPLPRTLVQVPDIKQIQDLMDRMRGVGDLLVISIRKYGDLDLKVSTNRVSLGAQIRKLPVIKDQAEASPGDWTVSAQDCPERVLQKGDVQSVQVLMKHFTESLYCDLAKPDCTFYGIGEQDSCLTVIFRFFIPVSQETDRSISFHVRIPALDLGSN